MEMILSLATVALMALYLGLGVIGALLAWRRRGLWRVAGAVLALQAALALAAQVALSILSPGIGEPFIRIRLFDLLAQVGGGLLVVGAVAGALVIAWRGLERRVMPGRPAWPAVAGLLLVLPVVAAGAMYAMVRASTPERERERDPNRRELTLAQGFAWSLYAQSKEWDNPTVMTFGPDGKLYVGDINGSIWVVSDARDGKSAATITRLADGFQLLLGLAWHDGELFVASQGKIEALRDANRDGTFDQRRTVVEGLPAMILRPHSNNSITFGPDGRLYFGVGATTAAEHEPYELAASVLSVKPDGSDLKVFARGFGNTFAVAFNREGQMFGGDNSSGADPDEFNHIAEGEHYGFPYFAGDPPKRGGTNAPLLTFPPHSSPTGLSFYTGATFPTEYRDSAFITLWARGEIQRIEVARTSGGAYLSRATPFASGFLYPIGVVTGPDGNLYVADFGTSAIYKIVYTGRL